jgi:hypothetical protein
MSVERATVRCFARCAHFREAERLGYFAAGTERVRAALLERMAMSTSEAEQILLVEELAGMLRHRKHEAETRMDVLEDRLSIGFFDRVVEALARATTAAQLAEAETGVPSRRAGVWRCAAVVVDAYVRRRAGAERELRSLLESTSDTVRHLAASYLGLLALERGDGGDVEALTVVIATTYPMRVCTLFAEALGRASAGVAGPG